MIYSLTAIILFLFSLIVWNISPVNYRNYILSNRKRDLKRLTSLVIISTIWLILHDGLRWEIGTDWSSYYDAFVSGENEHMGIGYSIFNSAIRFLTKSYTVFLIIFASITYIVFGKLFYKYSDNPIASFCLYYCSMLGLLGCNRQILACVVCMFSIRFIVSRKLIPFILCVFIAASMHFTAILFIGAYFVYNLRYSQTAAFCIITIAFLSGIFKLADSIPYLEYVKLIDYNETFSYSIDYYSGSFLGQVSMFGSLRRILYVVLAIIVKNRIDDKRYDFFLMLYIIGVSIYLFFNGSIIQIAAGRGAMYYEIAECIVLPCMLVHLPFNKLIKIAVWLFIFGVYFYLMWRNINSYYILDGVDIYNPYKCVLFNSIGHY